MRQLNWCAVPSYFIAILADPELASATWVTLFAVTLRAFNQGKTT
jgi:hypothetical protein